MESEFIYWKDAYKHKTISELTYVPIKIEPYVSVSEILQFNDKFYYINQSEGVYEILDNGDVVKIYPNMFPTVVAINDEYIIAEVIERDREYNISSYIYYKIHISDGESREIFETKTKLHPIIDNNLLYMLYNGDEGFVIDVYTLHDLDYDSEPKESAIYDGVYIIDYFITKNYVVVMVGEYTYFIDKYDIYNVVKQLEHHRGVVKITDNYISYHIYDKIYVYDIHTLDLIYTLSNYIDEFELLNNGWLITVRDNKAYLYDYINDSWDPIITHFDVKYVITHKSKNVSILISTGLIQNKAYIYSFKNG